MPSTGDQGVRFKTAMLTVNVANPSDHPILTVNGGVIRIDLSTLEMEFRTRDGHTAHVQLYVSQCVEIEEDVRMYNIPWTQFRSDYDDMVWACFDGDILKMANVKHDSCIYRYRYI
jgi:hypothetical protein